MACLPGTVVHQVVVLIERFSIFKVARKMVATLL